MGRDVLVELLAGDRGGEQRLDIELEGDAAAGVEPSQQRRVQLADPPGLDSGQADDRRPRRVQERAGARLEIDLDPEGLAEELDQALGVVEVGGPRIAAPSVRAAAADQDRGDPVRLGDRRGADAPRSGPPALRPRSAAPGAGRRVPTRRSRGDSCPGRGCGRRRRAARRSGRCASPIGRPTGGCAPERVRCGRAPRSRPGRDRRSSTRSPRRARRRAAGPRAAAAAAGGAAAARSCRRGPGRVAGRCSSRPWIRATSSIRSTSRVTSKCRSGGTPTVISPASAGPGRTSKPRRPR